MTRHFGDEKLRGGRGRGYGEELKNFKDNYDKERIRQCGMRLDPFLSGGQKQQMEIAWAMLCNCSALLVGDGTSVNN